MIDCALSILMTIGVSFGIVLAICIAADITHRNP